MKHLTIGRSLTLASIAALTACAEPTATPAARTGALPEARKLATGDEPWAIYDGYETSFTVDPSRETTVRLWEHRIVFAPGSICRINSSYGPSEWDKPCRATTQKTTIVVKITWDDFGRPRVDVHPNLRFVPGKDVTLHLKDVFGAVNPWTEILWCGSGSSGNGISVTNSKARASGGCVDESRTDASLRTRKDPLSGYLIRKLKHFSGYEVAAT